MQVVRTIFWVMVTAVIAAFVAYNWGEKVPVKFWPLDNEPVVFDWPVGFIALVFFLIGLAPTWLVARAARWRLQRRVNSLERALRDFTGSATPNDPDPAQPRVFTPAPDEA